MTKNQLLEIKNRYFRNGELNHHGDCEIYRSIECYGSQPCTCGFLHDLLPMWNAELLYPKIYEDLTKQDQKSSENLLDESFANNYARQLVEDVFGKSEPAEIEFPENDKQLIREVFGEDFWKIVEERFMK